MRSARRFAILAVFLLAPALLSPAPSGRSAGPYHSALSDLLVTPALAAGCGFKACQFVHNRIACARTTSAENCKSFSGACETKPCPV